MDASTTSRPLPAGAEPLDLTGLVTAWTAGDVDAIRSYYTADAIVATPSELATPPSTDRAALTVGHPDFTSRIGEIAGQTLRIVGQPVRVHDKLGAFFFRLEGPMQGRNGAAILRFEGEQVFLHLYTLADEPTPNTPSVADESLAPVPADLTTLVSWQGDAAEVLSAYVDEPTILNDEDVVGIATDPGYRPNPITSEISQMASMEPAPVGSALELGDLALAVWQLQALEPPVGYGVRLLEFQGDLVQTDVRFVIRPWERSGASFTSGY